VYFEPTALETSQVFADYFSMFQYHAFGEHHPIGRNYEFFSVRFKIISNLTAFQYDPVFTNDRPFEPGTTMNSPLHLIRIIDLGVAVAPNARRQDRPLDMAAAYDIPDGDQRCDRDAEPIAL